MDFNPRKKDRAQLLQLLDLWDSSLHSLFTVGRLRSFSNLSQQHRGRFLLSWTDSGMGKRRAAFQAFRKAVGFLHVMLPAKNGGRSKVWDHLNYPGPLRAPQTSSSRPLKVIVPDREMNLSCEVCIVGSGAGGGTAAAVLSAAGEDGIVLRAGRYFRYGELDGAELGGFLRLFTQAGVCA